MEPGGRRRPCHARASPPIVLGCSPGSAQVPPAFTARGGLAQTPPRRPLCRVVWVVDRRAALRHPKWPPSSAQCSGAWPWALGGGQLTAVLTSGGGPANPPHEAGGFRARRSLQNAVAVDLVFMERGVRAAGRSRAAAALAGSPACAPRSRWPRPRPPGPLTGCCSLRRYCDCFASGDFCNNCNCNNCCNNLRHEIERFKAIKVTFPMT